jgi:hypothetical protein
MDESARWGEGLIDEMQAYFALQHLTDPRIVDDMSWGLVDTKVLHVRDGGRDVVVKAAGPAGHHIAREITAHESYTGPLVERDRTGRLIAADRAANVLITEYQTGELVEGSPYEFNPDVHAQAGSMLRALHGQARRLDEDYEHLATAKAIAWLDREHRVEVHAEADARLVLNAYRPRPVETVPTHGDWQPRNWLIDGNHVRAIDFGRFEFRPPATDLARLATQQWKGDSSLESAFLDGYGGDPRDGCPWSIELLREAIGTAVWAYQVSDIEFEAHGHRLLGEALARF